MLSSTVTPDSTSDVVSMNPSAMYDRRNGIGGVAPQWVKVMLMIFNSVTSQKNNPE